MSQQQIEIIPHQQEQTKVIGKTSSGNYIIKAHLLSNVWALNGNRYDYRDASELPESFLNELVGLPVVPNHLHHELIELNNKLLAEGKTECQIRDALLNRSKDISIGVIDDVYKPGKLTFNSMIPETELYGAIEITDPVENAYIDKYGEPSKPYTSLGTSGEYVELPDGRTVYTDMTKARPIHLAMAENPAFGKDRAKVIAVCKGEKTTCKRQLMFQSLDYKKNESINTDDNDNTLMSKQELKDVPPTPNETKPVNAHHEPGHNEGEQEKKEKEDQDSTLEKPTAPEQKEQEPNKSEPRKESFDEDINKGNNKDNETEARLARLQQELEDQKRTFRKSLLKFSIDPRAFKSEDELKSEQDRVMNIMETYNLKNEDAEWLVTKAFPKFQAPNENKKGNNPVYNSMTFDVGDVTKSQGSSTTTESKKEYNKIIENEY